MVDFYGFHVGKYTANRPMGILWDSDSVVFVSFLWSLHMGKVRVIQASWRLCHVQFKKTCKHMGVKLSVGV